MNKSTRKTKTPKTPSTRKTNKAPYWARERLELEEVGNYASNHQVDPWRGQIMQISWDYCV